MSSLARILGISAPVDSEGQLRAAQSQTYSNDAEQQARAHGFPSAQAMTDFLRQRQVQGHNQVSPLSAATADAHDELNSAMLLHPKYLFEYLTNKYKEATGQ